MRNIFTALLGVTLFAGTAFANEEIVKGIQEAFEHYSVGGYAEAAPLFEESYNIMKTASPEDIKGRFKSAFYAGLSRRALGDYKAASLWFRTALAAADVSGNEKYKPLLYSYIGESEKLLDNYGVAAENYEKAIKFGGLPQKDEAALYYGLAECYLLSGDIERALNACTKTEEISQGLQLEKLLLQCSVIRGETYRLSGDYSNALKAFGAAIDMSRARRYSDVAVSALNGAGTTAEALGRNDMARSNFEEALSISLRNSLYGNVDFLASKIIALMPESGNMRQNAETMSQYSDELAALDGDINLILRKLSAVYYRVSKDYAKSAAAYTKLRSEAKAAGSKPDEINALIGLAEVHILDEEYKYAENALYTAYDEAKKSRPAKGDETEKIYETLFKDIKLMSNRLMAADPIKAFSDIFTEDL